MKTVDRYITTSYLVAFLVTLVVFTFVMCIAVVFRATDLIAKGVEWRLVAEILLAGVPAALAFSVPVSVLASALLVFGRLSADGEITALKASGISIWRIFVGPLLLSMWLAAGCLYLNSDLSPRSHLKSRTLYNRLISTSPLELLEAGRYIHDFEGLTIYIGRRRGEAIEQVRIYDLRTPGVKREVVARAGRLGLTGKDLQVELQDVRVDPFDPVRGGEAFCARWSLTIKDVMGHRRYTPREKDFRLVELQSRIWHTARYYPELDSFDLWRKQTGLRVERNKRFVLSLSCIAFVVLGVPLGIKAHRRESTVGIALSLVLVFAFYLFVIVAESIKEHPQYSPDLIIWLPAIGAVLVGGMLLQRNN